MELLWSPEVFPWMWGLLGLLIGSFLNVVIHRIPLMMERQWAEECTQWMQEHAPVSTAIPEPSTETQPFNLITPRSRCPHCGHVIRWYENLPVASWLALRGRCSQCHARISVRYPLVELLTGALFLFCAWRWGFSPTAMAWSLFCALLVALAGIDWDTTLLPDDLTYPLLWAGLLASALSWTQVPLHSAVYGAATGYFSLWLIYWGFKLATGREGMGFGDFKLFAALGAWFGLAALVPLILVASIVGAIVGIALKIGPGLREGSYIPFGPFLAGSGLLCLLLGTEVVLRSILSLLGMA